MSSESLKSVFRRLPRRLASSVASAMSIRSTHGRKRSMNHSTNGQASTARWTGRGRAASQASILPVLLVLIFSRAIVSPWPLDGRERHGALVQIHSHERLSTTTSQTSPCTGPKESKQLRRSVTTSPRPLHGFTLVELLVVIAIMAMLIGTVAAGSPNSPGSCPEETMHE